MANEFELKCRVEIDKEARGFDQKYDLLILEKMVMEKVQLAL